MAHDVALSLLRMVSNNIGQVGVLVVVVIVVVVSISIRIA